MQPVLGQSPYSQIMPPVFPVSQVPYHPVSVLKPLLFLQRCFQAMSQHTAPVYRSNSQDLIDQERGVEGDEGDLLLKQTADRRAEQLMEMERQFHAQQMNAQQEMMKQIQMSNPHIQWNNQNLTPKTPTFLENRHYQVLFSGNVVLFNIFYP